MWWTIVNCCPVRPLGKHFHGTFCSAGPLSGNFNKKFTTFYLEVFRPAGPLGGNFDKKFTTFYVDFSAPQGYSVGILIRNILSFIWIFCPAGPLGGNFDKNFITFHLDFCAPQVRSAGILIKRRIAKKLGFQAIWTNIFLVLNSKFFACVWKCTC